MIKIVCGDAHSLALSINGQVYGWGHTSFGQLGTGQGYSSTTDPKSTVKIPLQLEGQKKYHIMQIFAGDTFSLFVNDKREVIGCGLNDCGQLGIESKIIHGKTIKFDRVVVPRKINSLCNATIQNIESGMNHSQSMAVVDKHYVLLAFGMQRQGQLGLGKHSSNYSLPRMVKTFNDCMIYKMGCGAYHSAVIIGEVSNNFNNKSFQLLRHLIVDSQFLKNSDMFKSE